jgi:integrase
MNPPCPAHRVAKPRRLPNTRRALTAWELQQINTVARISGNDVILDALLLRLHTETACRRGGALGIQLDDLDPDRCLVQLRKRKAAPSAGNPSSQHSPTAWSTMPPPAALSCLPTPYSASVVATLSVAAATTNSGNDSATDSLWIAAQCISTHWLRHTTLTWVERHFGYAIARAYAGHTDSTGPATTTYIKANLQEVATALAAMTGQPHPLALPPWTLRSTRHPSERQPSRTRSSSWHT